MKIITCILVGLLAGPLLAQDLVPKGSLPSRPVLIQGATLHPVSQPAISDGWLLMEGGRIKSLGRGEAPRVPDAQVIDARGQHVWPGLIGAYTQLGLQEISRIRPAMDMDEVGDVVPEVHAAVAVNPDSTLLPVTRSNGVLTVGVFPSGGLVSGRASVMQLDGWTTEDMAIRADAGLVVSWPRTRVINAWWMSRSPQQQRASSAERLEGLEETFAAARAYLAARSADPTIPTDLRFEAMRSSIGSAQKPASRPTWFLAQDHEQILGVLAFAARHHLRPVIVGGREALSCREVLVRRKVPVVVLGTHRLPRRSDSPYDESYRLPLELEDAGIAWCLASGEETAHERNLPYNAATAAAHGLSVEAAVRSVTLSAARVLGVADELGSLEPGKRATLLVTDGHVLEVTTQIRHAFASGRRIDLRNKQTLLRDKYLEKYRQLGF